MVLVPFLSLTVNLLITERGDFDQRDITRIRNDILFVENYVTHNKRRPENSMNHMVCTNSGPLFNNNWSLFFDF